MKYSIIHDIIFYLPVNPRSPFSPRKPSIPGKPLGPVYLLKIGISVSLRWKQ